MQGETKVIKKGSAVKLPPGYETQVRVHSRVTGLSHNWIRRRKMDKKFTMINNYGLMRTYYKKSSYTQVQPLIFFTDSIIIEPIHNYGGW